MHNVERRLFLKPGGLSGGIQGAVNESVRQKPNALRLRLIERAATDERNFVKKAVSWALRGIGRRNRALSAATVDLARGLSTSKDSAARWIGKDALKELTSSAVLRRLRA